MPSRFIAAALSFALAPGAAAAHPGHYAPSAGHDHWIVLGLLGALGVAGLAALAKERRRRRREEEDAQPEDADADAAEAEA